jgi:hypothetical protein
MGESVVVVLFVHHVCAFRTIFLSLPDGGDFIMVSPLGSGQYNVKLAPLMSYSGPHRRC